MVWQKCMVLARMLGSVARKLGDFGKMLDGVARILVGVTVTLACFARILVDVQGRLMVSRESWYRENHVVARIFSRESYCH